MQPAAMFGRDNRVTSTSTLYTGSKQKNVQEFVAKTTFITRTSGRRQGARERAKADAIAHSNARREHGHAGDEAGDEASKGGEQSRRDDVEED